MRYNANELKSIAMTSADVCTKQGVLSLKEKEGKLWGKTDVHTERWCRLVDNMFFYFKTKDMTSDPYGVFVLEGSRVRPVMDENEGRAFVLEFDGDSRSAYFLASEPDEAKEWIQVLEDASYTKLKQKYKSLMQQQSETTAEDGSQTQGPTSAIVKETRSANSSPMLFRKNLSPTGEYSMTLSDIEGTSSSEARATKKKLRKKTKLKKLLHPVRAIEWNSQ